MRELVDIYGLEDQDAKWIIKNTDARDLLKIDLKEGDLSTVDDWAQDLSDEFEDMK